MRFKTILALLTIALLTSCIIYNVIAGDIKITNMWGAAKDVSLIADTGEVKAQKQSFTHEIRRPTGHTDVYVAHLVFIPDRRLVWVGYAKDKYVCFTNAIVGISTGPDTLVINKQKVQLHGSMEQQVGQIEQIAADFEKKMKAEKFDDLYVIDLGEKLMGLRGESPFLPPPQRVRPAKHAMISDIQIERGNMIVTLIGENNVKVVVVLDDSMNVVKGMIGDKVCYPRTIGSTNGIPSQPSTNALTK